MSVTGARMLFVTPTLPLPFGSADARWLHVVLSRLPARGADVTCLAVTADGPDRIDEARKAAADQGWRFAHAPVAIPRSPKRIASTLVRPMSHIRHAPGVLDALAELEPESFDLVHVEHLFTSTLTPHLPRSVTYLHHLEEVDWEGREGLTPIQRWAFLQMHRGTHRLLKTAPRLIAATERVADDAVRLGARTRPVVAPVALDLSLYEQLPVVAAPTVGVIGTMEWHPSLSAAQRVLTTLWPRIRKEVPEARLVVAGRKSTELLSSYFPLDGAELLGEVDHPTDFFGQVSVLVYPPRKGSGVKIKVVEALAYGVTVVSNAEGLEGITCDGCVVRAETDDEFVAGVVGLLKDDRRRLAMRDKGRQFVEQSYSADIAVDRLIKAYDELGLTA